MTKPRNGYHYPNPADSWFDAQPREMRHGWREIWVRRDIGPHQERRAGFNR